MAPIIMKTASLASLFLLLLSVYPSLSQDTTAGGTTGTTMPTTMVTSNMSMGNDTDDNSTMSNMTTATDMTTMTTMTTTTTTTTTTTREPVVNVGHNGMAFYHIHFSVGPTNESDIMYMGNKTKMELEMELMEAFMNVSAADISLMSMGHEDDHMMMMMMTYTLRILFLSSHIDNHTAMDLMDAIHAVHMMETYGVPNINMTNERIAEFATMTSDVCMADMVCPVGFRCVPGGCENLCQTEDCNGHGTCVVSVLTNGTATTICECDESYDTEYYGHRCEKDRRGKEQIIAIIAAVLGVAVLLLIIVLIVMCCLYFRRTHDAYDMKGQGYKNNAYDGVQD